MENEVVVEEEEGIGMVIITKVQVEAE